MFLCALFWLFHQNPIQARNVSLHGPKTNSGSFSIAAFVPASIWIGATPLN
jgi:hypothetical protein